MECQFWLVGSVIYERVALFGDVNVKKVLSTNYTCNVVLFVRVYESYLGISFRII